MKNCILLISTVFILAGCNVNKQPEPDETLVTQVEEPSEIMQEEVKVEEIVQKKAKRKAKKVKGTYYRMITKSIEVFTYRGSLKYAKVVNDKKLKNPFYIKGNLIRIEKVYNSEIGDQYGKIAGKNLLVSMDDLTAYKK